MLSDSGLMCIEENFVFDRIVGNPATLGFERELGKGFFWGEKGGGTEEGSIDLYNVQM